MATGKVFQSHFESVPNTLLIPRENEILVRMAEGKGYKVIAEEVGLKEKTARWYMGRINEKLDVNDKAAAVCRAFCLGILKPLCLLLVVSQVTLSITVNQPTRPVRTMPRVVRMVRAGRSIRDFSVIKAA